MGGLVRVMVSRCVVASALVWALAAAVHAQRAADAQSSGDAGSGAGSSGTISLTLPDEIELKLLIDLVSEQLQIQVLYDQKLASQRITVRAPKEVPRSALRGILESALRMNALALVEAAEAGWYKVVEAKDLTRVARTLSVGDRAALADLKPAAAVTQVFRLLHAEGRRVEQIVEPFLSEPGGNSLLSPDGQLFIVTDYASNLQRVGELIELVDRPKGSVVVEMAKVEHIAAKDAARELKKILAAKRTAGGAPQSSLGVEIIEQERTAQVILVGSPEAVEEAKALLEQVDVGLDLETKVYRFSSISPRQIDELTKGLIAPGALGHRYRSVVDETSGILVVTATGEIHAQVAALRQDIDAEHSETQPVIEFYKLTSAKAQEVLATIRQIEGLQRGTDARGGEGRGSGAGAAPSIAALLPSAAANSAPAGSPAAVNAATSAPETRSGLDSTGQRTRPGAAPGGRPRAPRADAVDTGRARIVADTATGTIIVVAPPAAQASYAELIHRLDRRRAQVLIELTLLTLDTSSSFSLAIELSKFKGGEDGRILAFSSFGLSEVDPSTGALSLIPGLGFNGTIVETDIAGGVIRALATSGRSRVMSSPKILVNDNATGSLNSVVDAPFTSVNASTTVATTSFGGFENAGTTVTVTPHISEGDHLNLEYSITLSTFTGSGGEGIPPPRQRNEIQSEVTIPDGYTIIVGGLTRSDSSRAVVKVPILGDIPLLGVLFRSQSENEASSTLFAFIRPVILRDDRFSDLKYLSEKDLRSAGLPANYPSSEPLVLR